MRGEGSAITANGAGEHGSPHATIEETRGENFTTPGGTPATGRAHSVTEEAVQTFPEAKVTPRRHLSGIDAPAPTMASDRNRSVPGTSEGPITASEEPTTASVMPSCHPGKTPGEPARFVANPSPPIRWGGHGTNLHPRCHPGRTPGEPARFVVNTPSPIRGRGARNEPAPLMSPHEAGRYRCIRVEALKTIDQLRQLITRGMRCPVFAWSKSGKLSVINSTVMLQGNIAWTLNTHELGEIRLPRDEQDARGFHIRPDPHTFRRRELLIELIGDDPLKHYRLTLSKSVTEVTLTGETAVFDPDHFTLIDWLRILVREQALVIDSTDIAREAFPTVRVRPGEEWRNVASRLVRTYRVLPDRPHASEATYFWRYAAERQLYELFERVINAVLTNSLDRLSLNALLHDAVARIKREVRPLPIAFHVSLGMSMRRRGKVTENVFSEFVDRLVLRSSAYRSVPVLPRNTRPSLSMCVTQLFSLDEVKQSFSSREQLTVLEPANSRSLGVPRPHPL